VPDYPADKIEIIAPLGIRRALAVADGARLTLSFDAG
jgi:CTP-dependent riboflavin kinase